MSTNQELLGRQPLAGLSPPERRRVYARSGMHAPNHESRTDADAFEIRNDVCVEDACITALRLMRAAVDQLDLLTITDDFPDGFRHVIEGIAFLGRLASGCVGLVNAALNDLPPLDQPALDSLAPRPTE